MRNLLSITIWYYLLALEIRTSFLIPLQKHLVCAPCNRFFCILAKLILYILPLSTIETLESLIKTSFRVKVVSPCRFALIFMPLFIGTLIFYSNSEFLMPEWLFMVQIISLYCLAWYLAYRASTASICITLDENGLDQVWEKRYLWCSHADMHIPWKSIISYKFSLNRRDPALKVYLRNARKWGFSKDEWGKDDFAAFVQAFNQHIERYNQSLRDGEEAIRQTGHGWSTR